MSPRERRNFAASVKQRLLNLAGERGEDFNFLLTRYGIERLLYRLSQSDHAGEFILKGAMLFHLASKQVPHRATRDLDLLGKGAPDLPRLENVFREIIRTRVDDDGLVFLDEGFRAERIRAEDEYAGVRLHVEARMAAARIPIQVDIGFGDAPVPAPRKEVLAALLEFPAPRLLIYSWETVIAEKFQALADLGMANSRMKDYFDLRHLSATLPFDGDTLARAIQATFERRRMPLPREVPTGLTKVFGDDPAKQVQWKAFLGKLRLDPLAMPLDRVVEQLRSFLMPPVEALIREQAFAKSWSPGGPWR